LIDEKPIGLVINVFINECLKLIIRKCPYFGCLGIAILPCYTHKDEVANNQIQIILPDYEIENLKLFLIRQHRDYMPLKMKVFSAFIKDWIREHATL